MEGADEAVQVPWPAVAAAAAVGAAAPAPVGSGGGGGAGDKMTCRRVPRSSTICWRT